MINNVNINKIVASNKVRFCKMDFKYFIDYKEAKTIRLICIFLPKTCAHRRNFDGTKYVYFLIKDDELLKKIQ